MVNFMSKRPAIIAGLAALASLVGVGTGHAGTINLTVLGVTANDGSIETSQYAGHAGMTTVNFNSPTFSNGQSVFHVGGATISGDGGVVSGNASGLYASPFHGSSGGEDTTQYLSLAIGKAVGSETISFATPVTYFGLLWGSEDSYNSITLTLLDGTTQSFTGADVAAMHIANGDQASSDTNRYANFAAEGDDPITGITLNTTNYAFESDNWVFGDPQTLVTFDLAPPVPEPGTIAVFAGGLFGLGFLRRKRR